MQLGEKVKILIKERGLKHSEVAQAIDMNSNMFSNYLSGSRKPSAAFLLSVINYFEEIDLNWLLRDTDTPLPLVNESAATYHIPVTPLTTIAKIERDLSDLKALLSQE